MTIHGWLILDKPAEMTSTKAGSIIKRLLKVKKIGHAGTLDPFATGVLPLALGEATKTIPYVVNGQKQYRFQITWGEERTTEDIDGEVTRTHPHRPDEKSIRQILSHFKGLINQQPPIYSALKIGGRRAYDLAREGKEVTLQNRHVQIDDLNLISIDNLHQATFEVTCGTGTYVRSLGRDIAQSLGTYGYLSQLRRLKVGKFNEDHVISVENFEKISHNLNNLSVILSIGSVLDDIPAVPVSEAEVMRIRQGQSIQTSFLTSEGETVALWYEDVVIAIGFYKNNNIYPRRVFNYN